MVDSQDAIRIFLDHLEPHPVITHAETQVTAAFQLLDLALAIDLPELFLGTRGPDKLAYTPNSRKSSWYDVPAPVSVRAASTSARSSSVSGSSSSGAARIDCHTGSASARRIFRAAGRSLAGM